MGAHKGNQNWKLRIKHGTEKKYTPEELAKGIQDYFTWAENTPIIKLIWLNSRHGAEEVEEKHRRPFTLQALCTHLEIVVNTFKNYEKMKGELEKSPEALIKPWSKEFKDKMEVANDYLTICTQARQIMYSQKYEGAAVGTFKESLIAADLGIKKKVENTIVTEQPLFPDKSYNEK